MMLKRILVMAMLGALVSAAPVAAADVTTLRFTVDNPQGTARAKVEQTFADLVEKNSNGRLKVQIFWSGSLGGVQRAAIDTVRAGGADLAVISTSNFSAMDRSWSLFDLPFLFNGPSGLYKYLDGREFGALRTETARKDGVHYVFSWYDDWRHLITTKRAVHTPDDVKGLKLRTTGSPIESAYDTAFAANPVSVDWGETYLALKNGLVDGYFVAYTTVADFRMDDAVKYGTTLNIVPIVVPIFMSEAVYQKLSPDLRTAVDAAGRQAEMEARQMAQQHNDESMKKLRGEGFTFYTPSPAERRQWLEKSRPVYAQFNSLFPAGLISKIQASQRV